MAKASRITSSLFPLAVLDYNDFCIKIYIALIFSEKLGIRYIGQLKSWASFTRSAVKA